MIVDLQVIAFSAYQLWVNFYYILRDKADISLVVLFPVECYTTKFKQVLSRVFQSLDILFQTFIAEWAAIAAYAARATWTAHIITDAIVADLLSRAIRVCSGDE